MTAIRWIFSQFRTLRGFVFVATTAIALLVFLGATLASSLLYERLIGQRTLDTSQGISRQTYAELYQVLRQGGTGKDIDEAVAEHLADFAGATHRIAFATPTQQSPDASEAQGADLRQVLSSGHELRSATDAGVRYTYPVLATAECLRCHRDAKVGGVLGALSVEHSLQPIATKVRIYYVALFLSLGLLVLLAAAGVSTFAVRRIWRSVDLLRGELESITSVRDLSAVDMSQMKMGFEEFDHISGSVGQLVHRMRDIAVDRDVLEFEIKLLEKFIITSSVVRDWREFIKDLLLDINPIIDAYALLTIFRIEEEGYEWEVFWRNTPSEETKVLFERIVRARLETNPHFQGSSVLHVSHHVADPSRSLRELSAEDIELQTKSLLLDTPKIGGIVGIGVHSLLAQDAVRHIVIGSILTTLLNLVGSVKAIYKYTKDLEYYATRDPLTDLHNQRMFWELLGYEVGRARRHEQEFAVMMLDMDNFKTVNDRYGHHFGDSFLQGFAKTLRQAVRPGDIVTRYGGDEFAVILPEAGGNQAHIVAERIGHMLQAFNMELPDSSRLKATTSVGIAVFPHHGENPRDLFLIADNMMYKAKKAGKNSIAFPDADEMAEVFKKASDKGMMVIKALEDKRIVPYFQPIVDAASGEVVIHELLMRIQLEDRVVNALEFVEEAEAMGLMHKMDYQLIEQAFAHLGREGYEGMLFINLSPKALIVGEFINRIHQLADEHQVQPSRIVFEITERETVSNLTLLEQFVADLRNAGFHFAVDDFGSGYSSFHYIKRFPVDYIKIEGEFIRHLESDPQYRAFTKSIVTLAKELGIKTVAEHVEDEGIMQAVREFGIDYAQGYHIGRPAPGLLPTSPKPQA